MQKFNYWIKLLSKLWSPGPKFLWRVNGPKPLINPVNDSFVSDPEVPWRGLEHLWLIPKSKISDYLESLMLSRFTCFTLLFSVISKGQARTDCYRFLAAGGGYAWVLTEATVIYNNSTNQPVSIVCVNFVIGWVFCWQLFSFYFINYSYML